MASLNDLGLALKLPIIQAPMAGVQDHALAMAVSEAGGLGSVPAAMLLPDGLRRELAALATRPDLAFNINFFCHRPPEPDPARLTEWLRLLSGYYEHFGIDMATIPSGAARHPFDAAAADLLAAQPTPPAVVSFHFGLPEPALLERVRGLGAKVLASATTLEEGVWLQDHGVDAVIAQGIEAGGHRGLFLDDDLASQRPMLELLEALVARLEVPVIAAGGIASAADVRAVLDRGAAAAQVGTAYLLCVEARTSALHRAALAGLAAESRKGPVADQTAITNLFTGRPARGIVNRLIRDLGPIQPQAPAFPLAANAIGPLRARAESEGSADFTPLWSGTNPAGCREISAGELTRALAGADATES